MTSRAGLTLPLVLLLVACGVGDEELPRREQPEIPAAANDPACEVPEVGPVSVEQLPEGSSVIDCDAVGRVVVWRGLGLTVPSPGEGADIFVTPENLASSPASFAISVSEASVVSYDFR